MTPLGSLALAPRAADHVVAFRGTEALTWGQFRAEIGGIACQMAGCRRAALLCRDSWNFAVGLFGLLSAGAVVVVPANDRPDTLARLLGEVDDVVDDDFEPGSGEWSQLLDETAAHLHFHTSGTSGAAKCVARSLGQMNTEIAALHALWGDSLSTAPVLATVPHQHAYGLMFKLLWPLAAGRPFFARQYDVWEEVLADLPAGALLVTSPAHLTRLGGLPPLAPDRRPRMILSAGSPLPEAAAREAWELLGVPVTEIYGSTETGAMATRRRDGGDPPWLPLPGYDIRRNDNGLVRLATPDGVSEIADRIEDDANGGFRLLGRADRIAKIEGKRVSLDEVERALLALPEIDAAAIVVLSSVLAAIVVPSSLGWADLATHGPFRFGRILRRRLAAGLEPAGLPRRWRFIEALPASPLGKPQLADLQALFHD
jgi:acyl-coenzyme A synthetase/AMP-(fatty) acid ligase